MVDKTFIGIDPGKNGAIVIISKNKITSECFKFIGDEYDIQGIFQRFCEIINDYENISVVLEDVKKLPSPMNSGDWELSACKHILMTILTILEIPYTPVAPKTWQKQMWMGVSEQRKPNKTKLDKNGQMVTKRGAIDTKNMSLIAAKRLFPSFDLRDPNRKTERSEKPHDGVVDAILMAEYCRRNFR